MVHGTYDIKINTPCSSQYNTNIQTTNFGDYKTEDYKRNEMTVVLYAMNYFGQ